MEKLYNVSEVAKLLGLSVSKVYKLAEQGSLRSLKIGTALRFAGIDIANFIYACRNDAGSDSNTAIDNSIFT
jgi:excisionase family DNA binding protein